MRLIVLLASLALALGGCDRASDSLPVDALSADAVILPGSWVPKLLLQCSRGTPPQGDGTWIPTAADIEPLERALAGELKRHGSGTGVNWSRAPKGWRRQYVGILRQGRKFIYGNYFQLQPEAPKTYWRSRPVMVCDGGPTYFGVEYDVTNRVFTHVAFNGPNSPPAFSTSPGLH